MNDKIILNDEDDSVVQDAFDNFMEDYELDSTMSIEDMLYEMFYVGFETALMMLEEEEEQ